MIFQPLLKLVVHSLRSPRAAVMGTGAIIIGLTVASMGTVAFAEPAAQAAAPTPVPCLAPRAGVVVVIDTPSTGDVIMPGANVTVQGVAYDTASTIGPGIDRVSVYLGDRDAGGIFWGDALLGQPSPQLGGALGSAGFIRRSPTIPVGNGGRDIFVYAHSSVSNREGSASVGVFLGAAPTPVRGGVPTPVLPPPAVCTPIPVPTATPTSAPTSVPPTPTSPPAAATPTPLPPVTQPLPAAPAPAAPPVFAPPPPAAAAPAAAAPAAQTTAPRGGGIPAELGLLLFGAGASVLGGGFALRRRERRGAPPRK